MSFDPIRSPVDYIVLRGQRSPGLATVENVDDPREWQERRPFGSFGARSVLRGGKLRHPVVKLRFSTSEHFAAWAEFRKLLERPRSRREGNLQAMDIEHPVLADAKIRSVGVENVIEPVPDGDTGGWIAEIRFIEHALPRRGFGVVNGSDDAPEPEDEVEREIRTLSNENARIQAEIDRLGRARP